MRRDRCTTAGGRRPLIGVQADWALCALLAFWAASIGAQTPAGTRIVARTTATYEYASVTYTVSDSVVVVVGQVAGVDVEPPRASTADAGASVVFSHTLANAGNGTDLIAVSATSSTGWVTRLYVDVDGDGALGPTDRLLSAPLSLAMGEIGRLLVVVTVPSTRAVRGVVDTITLAASSQFDPVKSDALVDDLTIRDAGVAINLGKSVDRPTATVGDVVTYTVTYAAVGTGAATEFEITDVVPTGVSYLPGTMRWNGTPLTDVDGDDAGFFDVANNRLVFRIGGIAGGESGAVTFQVRVDR